MAGAVLVIAETLLPWITLFAGLQRYCGLTGRNGRVVLAAGILALMLAIALHPSDSVDLRATTCTLGTGLTGLSTWLLIGALDMVRQGAGDAMRLTRMSPGLFVVVVAIMPTLAPLPCQAIREPFRHAG